MDYEHSSAWDFCLRDSLSTGIYNSWLAPTDKLPILQCQTTDICLHAHTHTHTHKGFWWISRSTECQDNFEIWIARYSRGRKYSENMGTPFIPTLSKHGFGDLQFFCLLSASCVFCRNGCKQQLEFYFIIYLYVLFLACPPPPPPHSRLKKVFAFLCWEKHRT